MYIYDSKTKTTKIPVTTKKQIESDGFEKMTAFFIIPVMKAKNSVCYSNTISIPENQKKYLGR
jgi:hypothetical protein